MVGLYYKKGLGIFLLVPLYVGVTFQRPNLFFILSVTDLIGGFYQLLFFFCFCFY